MWFGLGVLLQAVLLMRNDWNWSRLALCLGTGMVGFLPGKHEHTYEPLWHIFFFFCIFSFVFAMSFKEDILPSISEKILLSYTLVFWYSFFSFFYRGSFIHQFLFFMFLVPSMATVFIAYIKSTLNFWGKLFFYTWFLVIVISLGLFRFSFGHLSLFFNKHHSPLIGTADCLLTGMAFLYLVVNATYIWELIPIPGKHQSWENRMKEWHELTNLMTQRCDDRQPTHLNTTLILLLQGGGLFINYQYQLVPPGILMNILILLPVVFAAENTPTKITLQSSASMLE